MSTRVAEGQIDKMTALHTPAYSWVNPKSVRRLINCIALILMNLNKGEVMEIKTDSEVLEEITKEYNKDPETNWRVTAFRDEKGRYDLYVVKGKKFWQIKTEFITPYRYIGLGGKTTAKESESEYTFGLRPLPRKYVRKIVKNAQRGNISEELFKEIMEIPPVATTEISEEAKILQGPVLLSPLAEISPSQKELDKRLTYELDKLVFKEQMGSIYR